MFRKLLPAVAVVAGFLGWPGTADAGPLNCVGNVCTTSQTLGALSLDGVFSNLAKFDSDLGPLTGITITLSGTSDLSGAVLSGPSGATAVGDAGVELAVTLPTGGVMLIFPAIAVDWTSTGTDYHLSGGGVDQKVQNVGAAYFSLFSTSYSSTPADQLDVAPMNAAVLGWFDGRLTGASYDAGGTVTPTLEIRYTYGAVPEPATMVLIGSALLGLGMWRRRSYNLR